MNGIHDLGGMDGLGPILTEAGEPVFHDAWEKRAMSLTLLGLADGLYNVDEFRHAIERMAPAEYLQTSYYEHWLHALETLMVEKGIVTAEALAARRAELEGAPA